MRGEHGVRRVAISHRPGEAHLPERLQAALEAEHRDRFVAIEPESGDYFLADTLDAAVNAAIDKHPTRLTHVIRIGHKAAIHIGQLTCLRAM